MSHEKSDAYPARAANPSPFGDSMNRFRLLSVKKTCDILAISKSSLERYVRSQPGFPQPVSVGNRRVMFLAAEVAAYVLALPRAEYDDHAFDPHAPDL